MAGIKIKAKIINFDRTFKSPFPDTCYSTCIRSEGNYRPVPSATNSFKFSNGSMKVPEFPRNSDYWMIWCTYNNKTYYYVHNIRNFNLSDEYDVSVDFKQM
jgi:hypothetical protein